MKKSKAQHLILLGAGHSHLMVLDHLAKHPIPALRITVISRTAHIAYSGMMPGLIAGHYEWNECHLSLETICSRANAQLIIGEANHIDSVNRIVSGPNIEGYCFDWLSLNIGSESELKHIKGARDQGIAAKPIDSLIKGWHDIQDQFLKQSNSYKLAIIGGGAASVELALSIDYALKQLQHPSKHSAKISLITGSKKLLPNHTPAVGLYAKKLLRRRGIKLLFNSPVIDAHHYGVSLHNGETIAANTFIWATQAGSASWIKDSGVECDNRGFISVNRYLQSCSNRHIFAAGDIVNFVETPLPKSGVFAVRAGETLAENIHNIICNKPLKPFRPQRYFLNLLMTGNKNAIASWGDFSIQGKWVWYWKDYLDRKFMKRFK